MNILVIGGGGREHVIAQTISNSKHNPSLYAVMSKKNPGIASLCNDYLIDDENNIDRIVAYAKSKKVDIVVIGPEKPLASGLADALERAKIGVVGPKKDAGKIEFNKAWARNFMKKYNIEGCPEFNIFNNEKDVNDYIEKLENVAVKPIGLTGGKGVKVMGDQLPDIDSAKEYARTLLKDSKVVIEENLIGEEFTVQAFVDGNNLAFTPPIQDHKRAFENDRGPNTGGMGSYSSADDVLPFMNKEDIEKAQKILKDTVDSLYKETGIHYKGIIYGQFMLTKDGPKVIEYNARFGDPEAMNVLPLLENDFVDVLSAVVNGNLSEMELGFSKKATVCKYAVPEGYPYEPIKDSEIIIDDIGDALLYYASVYEEDGKIYTSDSRALAFVGVADAISEAENIAQTSLDNVKGKIQTRRDIGTEDFIQKKIDHMKQLKTA
ncbi:phosphoribosylamine--glycine ligase [Methanohalobium sp.]|uniref:phosphoribosylamine--glycine ligase n=1 Tax=Methanohalobium sp. TaxID=2837493 RepID=UPI0025E9C1D8|nr:phosphoribosylamine--glycine ligase [Methanohalobium sp.]